MKYLYHRAPKDFQGNTLYPLNVLKEKLPNVYESEVKKYKGRESLLEIKIPPLNCLWNDVLHLTAVYPSEIKKALVEAGREDDFEMKYFQIDPTLLEVEKTIVYLYIQENNDDISREDNFRPFVLADIEHLSMMPQATKDYYKELIPTGKSPLLYHRIPHILYRGSIDVSGCKVISV